MAFDRNARTPLRSRRAWQQVGSGGVTSSLLVNAPFSVATGRLALILDSAGGLEVNSGALRIKLADTSLNRTASGLSLGVVTTKGDLLGFAAVPARVPVGTNGQLLQADSTQANGVKWASVGDGSVSRVASSDVTVIAASSLTVVGDYEINSGIVLELAADANMEIL
jgi:hypothetical protein